MILRYSRDILFRYPRAFFAFILELKAISFQLPPRVFIFLYFSPPFTSHLFACYPFQSGSPPVYFLSIQLTSAFPSRCTHSIRSLFPPLFVIVFLSLIYLRFIFPLLVRFFYIYILGIAEPTVFLSGKRGWYFGKEESLPKIVRTQLPLSIRLSFEDVLLFYGIRG